MPDQGGFQYRKRYEVYCNKKLVDEGFPISHGFNTASGMRSIAINEK